MKDLHCKNCGGSMLPDGSARVAECLYCGTTYLLTSEEASYFRELFLQMNRCFSEERASAPWTKTDTQAFRCEDGERLQVQYLHRYTDRDADVYISRESVAYHLRGDGRLRAERYCSIVESLDYPSADVRKLSGLFPEVRGSYPLADGTCLLVIKKSAEEYPLRLFGRLDGRHVAWIVSRLENICCVLEYNGLVHPRICVDSVYINPRTHQAFLYGDWWRVGRAFSAPVGSDRMLLSEDNLIGVRNTAAVLLGCPNRLRVTAEAGIPDAFAAFLAGKPCEDAYEDFALWDETLIKAYGERKFVNLDINERRLYGGEE